MEEVGIVFEELENIYGEILIEKSFKVNVDNKYLFFKILMLYTLLIIKVVIIFKNWKNIDHQILNIFLKKW